LRLGTVYNQPFWIFHSSTEPLNRLSQLKGKRIAVGPEGSATRLSAGKVLGKGGVNSQTATLLPFAGLGAVKALDEKKVDAVWIIGSPDATAVKSFLENSSVHLLGFPMGEAFTRIYPDLIRLALPKGVVDIDRAIPPEDVPLIGTTTKVLVRSDLNPEIVQLLLQTMMETHRGPEIFQRSGEFPNGTDAEYPMAPTAIDFYKNGPSFMHRHLPLWLAVHVQRAIAVLVAAIAIGLPLFHYLPLLYKWSARQRLLHWYGQLKTLEASFDNNPSGKHLTEMLAEVERIEDAVSHIRFPLTFTDQLYHLRGHVDIVRRKITARAETLGRMAA
jgi:NMT1-like family